MWCHCRYSLGHQEFCNDSDCEYDGHKAEHAQKAKADINQIMACFLVIVMPRVSYSIHVRSPLPNMQRTQPYLAKYARRQLYVHNISFI